MNDNEQDEEDDLEEGGDDERGNEQGRGEEIGADGALEWERDPGKHFERGGGAPETTHMPARPTQVGPTPPSR